VFLVVTEVFVTTVEDPLSVATNGETGFGQLPPEFFSHSRNRLQPAIDFAASTRHSAECTEFERSLSPFWQSFLSV